MGNHQDASVAAVDLRMVSNADCGGLVLVEKGDVESVLWKILCGQKPHFLEHPILLTLAIEQIVWVWLFKKNMQKKPESRGVWLQIGFFFWSLETAAETKLRRIWPSASPLVPWSYRIGEFFWYLDVFGVEKGKKSEVE